jgi:hypothetical protein
MRKTKVKSPIPNSLTVADDGQIAVTIQGGPADGQHVTLDVYESMLEFDAIQGRYTTGGKFTATADFLRELASVCERLGVKPCSPTAAYRIWHAVSEQYYGLKKNMPTPQK